MLGLRWSSFTVWLLSVGGINGFVANTNVSTRQLKTSFIQPIHTQTGTRSSFAVSPTVRSSSSFAKVAILGLAAASGEDYFVNAQDSDVSVFKFSSVRKEERSNRSTKHPSRSSCRPYQFEFVGLHFCTIYCFSSVLGPPSSVCQSLRRWINDQRRAADSSSVKRLAGKSLFTPFVTMNVILYDSIYIMW